MDAEISQSDTLPDTLCQIIDTKGTEILILKFLKMGFLLFN